MSILDKVIQNDSGDFYNDIVETCATYNDYGKLLTELLEYFSGSSGWDEKVADMLEEMYSEYYADIFL